MAYRSHFSQASARVNRARDRALTAAGYVVLTQVKDNHRGGYTSGLFVTGNEISKIILTEPRDYPGGREVAVTTEQTDPPYPFWWATGHQNRFTRRFERVDHWTPAASQSATGAKATYDRVFAEEMAAP